VGNNTHRVLAPKLERRTLEDLVANGRIMLKMDPKELRR